MQIGSRFTEYGLTGGFFWICQLFFLTYSGQAKTLLSYLSSEQLKQQLEQILTNLVSNAIKYSPQDGPITVSIRQTNDGYVEIDVEDQGIGIPPEAQTHLTERFFRAENAMSVDSKGLGLGLYLVNALVTGHGGTLSIKSEGIAGKGSTFTVRLPIHQP